MIPTSVLFKIAVETIENIRTVATLTKEDKFYADYVTATSIPTKYVPTPFSDVTSFIDVFCFAVKT